MKRYIQTGFILWFLVILVTPSWGSDLYAAFAGAGIQKWNGTTWSQITPYDPQSMAASGSTLYAAFGAGLHEWNGSAWIPLNPVAPTSMVASGSTLYAAFGAAGLHEWNGSAWIPLNPVAPTSMAASGSTLYADFAGYGIQEWNGTTWNQINAGDPTSMVDPPGAVPEPATMLLLGIGLMGLVGMRRKFRN